MPFAVAATTRTTRPLGADRDTVNAATVVPVSPSATEASSIERTGVGSSSRIVPVACPSPSTAPAGPERRTRNVSSASSRRSETTGTVMVRVVVPAGKLSKPAVEV